MSKLYKQRKDGMQTSAFGTPGRINHDSDKFYKSKLYDGLRVKKNKAYRE